MTATALPIATEPRVWSYSSLNQLLRVCSLQFFFERVERLEPEQGSAAAALGTAIHYAAGLARRQQAAGQLDRAEVRGVFSDAFAMSLDTGLPLVFPKNADAASLRELGVKLVDVFLDDVADSTDEVVAVEQDFQVPITLPDGSVRQVTGAPDLVVREEDGVLTVTDLKTASSAYSPVRVDNDLQATFYSYAAEQLYGEQVRVRFDVLVKTKEPRLARAYTIRDEGTYDRLRALVAVGEQLVAAGAYAPADGSMFCGSCGHRRACARWPAL